MCTTAYPMVDVVSLLPQRRRRCRGERPQAYAGRLAGEKKGSMQASHGMGCLDPCLGANPPTPTRTLSTRDELGHGARPSVGRISIARSLCATLPLWPDRIQATLDSGPSRTVAAGRARVFSLMEVAGTTAKRARCKRGKAGDSISSWWSRRRHSCMCREYRYIRTEGHCMGAPRFTPPCRPGVILPATSTWNGPYDAERGAVLKTRAASISFPPPCSYAWRVSARRRYGRVCS